jgi:RNA polymerase sigma-70 factor (ECF subfamily)
VEASFAQLYAQHYRAVFGLCRQMLRRTDQAEDAAQEVFLRAYRAFGAFDPNQPFKAWIMTIATRHCVDLVRRRAKERTLFGDEPAEAQSLEDEGDATVGTLLTAERAEAVKSAVQALPDKYRVPLLLAYYNEASYDEIAAARGITRNHVGILLLRGKRALRASLAAEQIEETT